MSARDIINAGAASSAAPTYVEDVFSTYLYTGNGSTQIINNGINLASGFIATYLVNGPPTLGTQPIWANGSVILAAPPAGAIKYSTDNGISWNDNASGTSALSIIYFNNRWIAAGTGGIHESTNNGVDWYNITYVQSTSKVVRNLNGVLYVGKSGSFDEPTIIRSTDGISWTNSGPINIYFNVADILFNGTTYVAVGNDPTTAYQPTVIYSSNGTSWSSGSTSGVSGSMISGCVHNNKFYVLTETGSNYYVYSSTNGTSWSLVLDVYQQLINGSTPRTIISNGSYIFLTGSNISHFSTDGASWSFFSSQGNYAYVVNSDVFLTNNNTPRMFRAKLSSFDFGKGGLVWTKNRSTSVRHVFIDSARGNFEISSHTTAAQSANSDISFTSTGYSLSNNTGGVNNINSNFVSWTFRKQPKFFDVVTYTGNGSNRTIAHNLGSVPGMIIVKQTDTGRDWQVYHRSLANTERLVLNDPGAVVTGATSTWNSTTATASVFSLGTASAVNLNGGTYVAYLFAHDAGGFGASGSDNVISCGSVTTPGTGVTTEVNLGWEPQWILLKNTTNAEEPWYIIDSMRGMTVSVSTPLLANSPAAESPAGPPDGITATGFRLFNREAGPWIYIAIRRGPMRTPTTGTSVYSGTTWTGNALDFRSFTSPGFPPDMLIAMIRNQTSGVQRGGFNVSRLVGTASGSTSNLLDTTSISAATTANPSGGGGAIASLDQTGFTVRYNLNREYDGFSSEPELPTYQVAWSFRRAAGFFDVVCYTGTGSARTVTHNLTVAPELMIVKQRNAQSNWRTYVASLGASQQIIVNVTDPSAGAGVMWNSTAPTASDFSLGNDSEVNGSGGTYVAYLFATVAGVSKVGSFTGNGSSQTINCGFTGGARFVLIKRTDSTGDWYVWDSARGIVSANDPHLSLNAPSSAGEINTDDSIDPNSTGFAVNQVSATNINVTSATYIYFAIA